MSAVAALAVSASEIGAFGLSQGTLHALGVGITIGITTAMMLALDPGNLGKWASRIARWLLIVTDLGALIMLVTLWTLPGIWSTPSSTHAIARASGLYAAVVILLNFVIFAILKWRETKRKS